MQRGYFGIGIYNGKTADNLGTLWRSAENFGASYIFTIGNRYKLQSTDTTKAHRHTPLHRYTTPEEFRSPYDCQIIGIEQTDDSESIVDFKHPERAVYILGAEDNGLPQELIKKCSHVIYIPTPSCINVAVAGSIVMYDRKAKIDRS